MADRPPLFLSHASADDAFVGSLQKALADLGQPVWIDSRHLMAGDKLNAKIIEAIETASAFAVLVSPASLQSAWVGKELSRALKHQQDVENYPVIALALDGTKLGVLEHYFDEERIFIPLSSKPGGLEEALPKLLPALGLKLPADIPIIPPAPAQPLEDLVLELTDLGFEEKDGKRRPKAKARLVYEPASPGKREVKCKAPWTFVAPLGPIESNELRWYLEEYAIWPCDPLKARAAKVEQDLQAWGQSIHQAALPDAAVGDALPAWQRAGGERRFSVEVDGGTTADAPQQQVLLAREAATALLALPWELLHDGSRFLFQGAKPVRVRRSLPNTRDLDIPPSQPPIRVLLVTARPEDEACAYLDHRISAKPLVQAMETLGGLVELSLLNPPTFPQLLKELERASQAGQPYHVVHFDGHGVYSRHDGLGGLCFEDPQDQDKLECRRHQTLFTDKIGPALQDHRIPLVFLEACQTAKAEDGAGSVASELLKAGVASVIAMTHSVLVATAWRFVEAFYQKLAEGARVGEAMLAAQKRLHDDSFRAKIFGAGELHLQDWFVPVLYQEKEDPRLFTALPQRPAQAATAERLENRLGALPPPPKLSGFIGRSRELLKLQRLLTQQRWALVRGNGGEGKTALAVEYARWQVQSRQANRAAFVSVELDTTPAAVLNALVGQLVGQGHAQATPDKLEPAFQEIERELAERPTVLVIDNLESLLTGSAGILPAKEDAEKCGQDARAPSLDAPAPNLDDLTEILSLCQRLNKIGATRILYTSRENLPAAHHDPRQTIELERLAKEDALQVVEQTLQEADLLSAAQRGAIEDLLDAVQCHARTLALLAEPLREKCRQHGVVPGLEATRAQLTQLMEEMHRQFPDSREHSLYASLELSLRRLSPDHRERAKVLGVFHGELDLDVLRLMMDWTEETVAALGQALADTGLAIPMPHKHLRLEPALCPYLRARLPTSERAALEARWTAAMRGFVEYLYKQLSQDAALAARLTGWETPNLMALLEITAQAGESEFTVDLCASLFGLLQNAGKPRLLQRIASVREAADRGLGQAWNHARFQAQRIRIEHALDSGDFREALDGAQDLHRRAQAAGEQAYAGADYDLAIACFLLGRVLETLRASGQALPLLQEARQRFEQVEQHRPGRGAARMASAALAEQGDCLNGLGRYDEAAVLYEEAIRRAEQQGDLRQVAVGKGQLGTVRLMQERYGEALKAYEAARDAFAGLGEPGTVAGSWHQIGMVHEETGQYEQAEQAYRESLALSVRLGNAAAQASTLNQLGALYGRMGRWEDAATFYGQAADKAVELGDMAKEGSRRNNLAHTLRQLGRLDEARTQCRRAIQCKEAYGHAATPWTTWDILHDIETAAGQPQAAQQARRQAIALFLAYRRDGGENHTGSAQLCADVAQALAEGKGEEALGWVNGLRDRPDWQQNGLPLLDALQAILQGHRTPALADDPKLDYDEAVEILLLLERLPPPAKPGLFARLLGRKT